MAANFNIYNSPQNPLCSNKGVVKKTSTSVKKSSKTNVNPVKIGTTKSKGLSLLSKSDLNIFNSKALPKSPKRFDKNVNKSKLFSTKNENLMIRSPISNNDDFIFKKPYAKENIKTNHSDDEKYRDSERLNIPDLLIDNIDVLKGDCLLKNKTFLSSPLKMVEEKDCLKYSHEDLNSILDHNIYKLRMRLEDVDEVMLPEISDDDI